MSDLIRRLNADLEGRYRIERELGVGGMATVYLAYDRRHDSRVALKVLRPELAPYLGGERFVREIWITAQLQHPNILPVFDSGELGDTAFYVMPFVDGETLAQRLTREGPLPVPEAVWIAAEIADALAYAHERGFVHRDVKPSNIMLAHGHALLADFGIARTIDEAAGDALTETGLALGTVAYMSPEQATGTTIDGRTDIYSLGCVLYEMLAGSPPFTGPPQAVLARHSADTVPSLRIVRETVPESVEQVIVRALAKTPADRFATAAELRDALRQAITAPTPVSPPTPSRRWPTWMKIGLPAALALAATATLWLGVFSRSEPGLAEDRVMMMPLRVSEGLDGPPSVGEDVATLVVNALDGAGALRWLDGLAQLDPTSRDSYRVPAEEEARRIARTGRAAHFVTGSITPMGDDRIGVALRLHDTDTGDVVRTAAPGATSPQEAWRAGLRAANDLLSSLIEGAPDIEAEWHDRDPRAIASFLRGEAAFRRVHLEQAVDRYREALELDSTFALAAVRGAQAAGWNHEPREAAALIDRARTLPLPPRYADFANGFAAYLSGDAEAAATALRRTVTESPEMAEAWMQLGETYTHLLPKAGDTDSLALAAFEEARRLDPTASHILLHVIEIRLRRGETDLAGPLLDRFRAGGADTVLATKLDIMQRCVRDGPDAVEWTDLAARKPFELVDAAKSLTAAAARPDCAVPAYRALLAVDTSSTDPAADGRRWAAQIGLQSLLVARGRADEAVREIEAFDERWGYGKTLLMLDATVDDAFTASGLDVARESRDRLGPYASWPGLYRLWGVGVTEAIAGDTARTKSIIEEVARRAAETGTAQARNMEASLRAHLTLARGDSARALERFDALVPPVLPGDELSWDEFAPLGVERLALARLLMARGDFRRALGTAEVFDSQAPLVYALFQRASLELRIEAATRVADALQATRYRRRLEALER